MDSPSPSNFSLPDLTIQEINLSPCQICGRPGHGNHFGAITCRACAAFFRRFGISSNFILCRKDGKCEAAKNGWFGCKQCRLQKCWRIGMTIDNFQFQRDPHKKTKKGRLPVCQLLDKIPPTMDTFLRKSNLIIFNAIKTENDVINYIDAQFLIDTAINVLLKGHESPLFAESPLERLALGLQEGRKSKKRETVFLTKIGREETFLLWETDMLKVAKWLTFFADFQKLPMEQKHLETSKFSDNNPKRIWVVWSRLSKIASAAMARREKICNDHQIVYELENKHIVFDVQSVEIDLSWCSKYSYEQIKFFGPNNLERMDLMIQSLIDLSPTDVELSYMLCQLCFHHIGQRYQGEILKITDKLMEKLSDNLHDYYTNRLKKSFYSVRIAHMMRVNNMIQEKMAKRRAKVELMKVFDVFNAVHSDPEMFLDF